LRASCLHAVQRPVVIGQLRAQTFRVFVYATSAPLISFGFWLVVESRAVLSS